jgi:hypothetical protein
MHNPPRRRQELCSLRRMHCCPEEGRYIPQGRDKEEHHHSGNLLVEAEKNNADTIIPNSEFVLCWRRTSRTTTRRPHYFYCVRNARPNIRTPKSNENKFDVDNSATIPNNRVAEQNGKTIQLTYSDH